MPAALRYPVTIFLLVLCLLGFSGSPVAAEDFLPSRGPAAVSFNNQTLFILTSVTENYTAEERARIIEDRIRDIIEDLHDSKPKYQLVDIPGATRVLIGDKLLMVVNDEDSRIEKMPRHMLAEKRAQAVEKAIQRYQDEYQQKSVWLRIGIAVITTVIFVLLWRILGWLFRRLDSYLQSRQPRALPLLKILLLSETLARSFMNNIPRFFLWFIRLLLLYSYTFVLLKISPRTREYSDQILSYFWRPLTDVAAFLFEILPDMATILVILVIFWYILGFIRFICWEMEQGNLTLGGFHPEWVAPTYALIRILVIALAVIAIFPYIPGSHSPVFQGMSVFLGLLFSVSSSSALSNIVAGYVLIYTRAFKEGDVIRVGEYNGIVERRELLATRVLTFKNESVTVPNSLILSGSIMNFSAHIHGQEKGLTLHTTVTIGYDAPWRKVHELLNLAADRTENVLKDPPPFVLQTALNDFYVAYELNAFTRVPEKMPALYSDLHRNIQDCFNEGGVEIMSPHYTAFRNGNQTTIPEDYLPVKR